MIPKKIHYCWFGGNELPESARKCIDSWKNIFQNMKSCNGMKTIIMLEK